MLIKIVKIKYFQRNQITYQDAVNLKYCSCVFKEALRLFPPAPVQDRLALDELNINGIRVPENTVFHVKYLIATYFKTFY